MFDQDMERLEHEIDDSLLFYYAAQSETEKEAYLIRVVEACLERLQCCLNALRNGERVEAVRKCLGDYIWLTDYTLQEGLSAFLRNDGVQENNYWRTLTELFLSVREDLESFQLCRIF